VRVPHITAKGRTRSAGADRIAIKSVMNAEANTVVTMGIKVRLESGEMSVAFLKNHATKGRVNAQIDKLTDMPEIIYLTILLLLSCVFNFPHIKFLMGLYTVIIPKVEKKLIHKPISRAEFGLKMQIESIAIPKELSESDLRNTASPIRYIIDIISAFMTDGVKQVSVIKARITKAAKTAEHLMPSFSFLKSHKQKQDSIEICMPDIVNRW
jgi:hypothetical protein